jgi:hypothetical protein
VRGLPVMRLHQLHSRPAAALRLLLDASSCLSDGGIPVPHLPPGMKPAAPRHAARRWSLRSWTACLASAAFPRLQTPQLALQPPAAATVCFAQLLACCCSCCCERGASAQATASHVQSKCRGASAAHTWCCSARPCRGLATGGGRQGSLPSLLSTRHAWRPLLRYRLITGSRAGRQQSISMQPAAAARAESPELPVHTAGLAGSRSGSADLPARDHRPGPPRRHSHSAGTADFASRMERRRSRRSCWRRRRGVRGRSRCVPAWQVALATLAGLAAAA